MPDPASRLRHKPQPSGSRNPSGVHLLRYNPRPSVGAARCARPRFLDRVRPGTDWRGVGWLQALEAAFKKVPDGVAKAMSELKLQEARVRVAALQPARRISTCTICSLSILFLVLVLYIFRSIFIFISPFSPSPTCNLS